VEEILEGGDWEISVSLIDLGEDGGVDTGDGSLVDFLFSNLTLEVLGSLGVLGEGKDVRVVAEEEHLLLG
jgi:hypothetical protein